MRFRIHVHRIILPYFICKIYFFFCYQFWDTLYIANKTCISQARFAANKEEWKRKVMIASRSSHRPGYRDTVADARWKGRRTMRIYTRCVVTYISKNLGFKIVRRAKSGEIPVVATLRCSPMQKPHVVNYAIRPHQLRKRDLYSLYHRKNALSCKTIHVLTIAYHVLRYTINFLLSIHTLGNYSNRHIYI